MMTIPLILETAGTLAATTSLFSAQGLIHLPPSGIFNDFGYISMFALKKGIKAMGFSEHVLAVNDDLPIRTAKAVHSGKVRSVYFLTKEDSKRLIQEKNYPVALDTPLAVMVISDRISAFDCIWHGEQALYGVPGKGAALNAIAYHWFSQFKQEEKADHHILDVPHPLVWIVQVARPVKIEAICRQYLTGSMWRAYEKGERVFCGIALPDGLEKNARLPQLLITPSTKGILKNIPNVPEVDDVNISREDIEKNFAAFGFSSVADINCYEKLLIQGFDSISRSLEKIGQHLVDTKFEFGYVKDSKGNEKLIYMDEVGTPDSSRIWDAAAYEKNQIIENSKEGFRQFLLNYFQDPDILLNKDRMPEREALARNNPLPLDAMLSLSNTYLSIAEKITQKPIQLLNSPRQEIIAILSDKYQLIKDDI